MSRFDPTRGSFATYLHVMARSMMLTLLQRERPMGDLPAGVPDPGCTDALDAASRREQLRHLRAVLPGCLGLLTPEELTVFLLCEEFGLGSWKQTAIAEFLGVANATVTRRKESAREKLRAELSRRGVNL